jgi:hypothetical protein
MIFRKKAKTRLVDLKIDKVSLVDRPANRRPFLVLKNETGGNKMKVTLAELMAQVKKDDGQDKGTFVDICKNALKENPEMLAQFNEAIEKAKKVECADGEVPEDELTGMTVEEKKKAQKLFGMKKDFYGKFGVKVNKNGDPLTADPMIVQLWKSQEALYTQNAELTARVEKAADDASNKERIAKAEKEFSHVPVKAEMLATIMKSAESLDEASQKEFNRLLKSFEELSKQSKLIEELGGTSPDPTSAIAQIEAIAKTYEGKVTKADGKTMNHDEAIVKAVEDNPELYEAYEEERRASIRQNG